MTDTTVAIRCALCDARTDVVDRDPDGDAVMEAIFEIGWHVVHIEPALPDEPHAVNDHSHSLVCGACAKRIAGRKPT